MDKKIWISSIVLAVIGLIDSIYLVWVKFTDQYALCGPIGNCESVNTSQYSEIWGIPIALLGAGAYIVIIILLLLENRSELMGEYSPLIVFGISLIGVLYSIYLTYVEVVILRAICPYCVISAVVLVLLLVLSTIRLLQSFRDPGAQSKS
jgi:uncharacterized membrane protein